MLIAHHSSRSNIFARLTCATFLASACFALLPCGTSYAATKTTTKTTSSKTTTTKTKNNSSTTSVTLTAQKATQADKFVDSMGIVIHLENTGTIYQTGLTSIIEPALVASGIRHVRDGGLASSTNSYGMNQLYTGTYTSVANYVQKNGGHRLGFELITAPLDLGSSPGKSCNELAVSPVSTFVKYFSPSLIDGFEGINEYDWEYPIFTPNCATATTWPEINAKFQQALWEDVTSNPLTKNLPVAGPSFGTPQGNAEMVSVSAYEDYGNQHSYPAGRPPSADILPSEVALDNANANKPYVATETGYYTQPDGVSGVSEAAAGKYMTRLYYEYYNAGIAKTYTYELIDEVDQPTWHAHFGLLRADGSAKPSFVAIANTISILSDPGPAFTPGTLEIGAGVTMPSTLHHCIFQKRNGTFEVPLWQEISTYNLMTETDLTNATFALPLTIGFTASKINIYDPLVGTKPVETFSNTSTVTVNVPDHALIVEIIP